MRCSALLAAAAATLLLALPAAAQEGSDVAPGNTPLTLIAIRGGPCGFALDSLPSRVRLTGRLRAATPPARAAGHDTWLCTLLGPSTDAGSLATVTVPRHLARGGAASPLVPDPSPRGDSTAVSLTLQRARVADLALVLGATGVARWSGDTLIVRGWGILR